MFQTKNISATSTKGFQFRFELSYSMEFKRTSSVFSIQGTLLDSKRMDLKQASVYIKETIDNWNDYSFRLLVMYFILPETEQRSLEDIEMHYSDNKKGITDIYICKNSKTVEWVSIIEEKICTTIQFRLFISLSRFFGTIDRENWWKNSSIGVNIWNRRNGFKRWHNFTTKFGWDLLKFQNVFGTQWLDLSNYIKHWFILVSKRESL